MPNGIEIPYMFKLLGSIFLAFLLFGIALIFIKKTKDKREKNAIERRRETLRPFPQEAHSSTSMMKASDSNQEEREAVIRARYQEWLQRYFLPTYDARAAFMRVGVERRRLRYQVTTTSLGQALGMFHAVLMSGDDLSAPDRFERLLAFLIAYPSNNTEDLSSWYTLPDMTAPAKLEADPHAEAWIAYSLLMGQKQWKKGELFVYDKVIDYRLSALLDLQQDIEVTDHKRAIYAPLFFEAFYQHGDSEAWQTLAQEMREELSAHIKGAEFALNGSAEEAWLAFSALHVGMAGLRPNDETHQKMAEQLESLVYSAIKVLPDHLTQKESEGLSPLALLACCAPAAMLQNDQELVNKYWQVLSAFNVKERDAIGESLRLLALLLLNNHVWTVEN